MVPILASDLSDSWWHYVVLFMAVTASWAGVPFIGAAAVGAAAVLASQGELDLAAVVIVATVAGEVGGLIGYAIGDRWGRQLVDKPGKRQASRQRLLERGEAAYAKWGRLAVFFTPAIISGTAKMHRGQFASGICSHPWASPCRWPRVPMVSDGSPPAIIRPMTSECSSSVWWSERCWSSWSPVIDARSRCNGPRRRKERRPPRPTSLRVDG